MHQKVRANLWNEWRDKKSQKIEDIKENQKYNRTKNTITFLKISLDKHGSEMEMTEERVSELEDRAMELSRLKNKEKNVLERKN